MSMKLLLFSGVIAFCSGVWLRFGPADALIAFGAICFVLVCALWGQQQ